MVFLSLPLQTYILIDFIYFSYSTCRQLADFLNIYILKINEPSDGSSSGGAGGGGGIGGGGPSVSTRAASNAGGGSQNGRVTGSSTRHRTGNVRRWHQWQLSLLLLYLLCSLLLLITFFLQFLILIIMNFFTFSSFSSNDNLLPIYLSHINFDHTPNTQTHSLTSTHTPYTNKHHHQNYTAKQLNCA